MIRIISGSLKGRKLKNTNTDVLRPTQAKVRKSIMDSIRIFDNKKVLDLFSGIGTLGIEALSRGAVEAKFVEKNYSIIKALKHNIELFDLNNRTEIIKSDVMRFLKNHKDRYDIIFADPPYRTYQFKELFPLILSLLNKKGIFCYESDYQNLDIKCGGNMKIKRYGQTQVILWENI